MINLKMRLSLTYSTFLCAAFAALFFSLNVVSKNIFDTFVRAAISERNAEIVRAVLEQYRPMQKQFDISGLETAGMIFMHDGFIVDVENGRGEKIWDARLMDMEHCVAALQEIDERMNKHGKKREVQNISFPVSFAGEIIGSVNIASVGPLFYTETQSAFIKSINIMMTAVFVISLIVCVVLSVIHAALFASPISAVTNVARKIAVHYSHGTPHSELEIALKEDFNTREFFELSEAINKMARELRDAQQRQKQLTGDIAHELRTPLTSIQGTIEAFIDGVWEASPEKLNALLYEIKRLAKLAEDLQVLSSFESGNITLNKIEFDIAELLQHTVGQFMSAARDKGLIIVTQLIPTPVFADYNRIKQVIINLLSNAVKYTDTGTITVSIENSTVKIADTGRGITREDLSHIFERFYRAEKSRNREAGGAGVGLTIATAICATHGWEICAESEGLGSVFTIFLEKT